MVRRACSKNLPSRFEPLKAQLGARVEHPFHILKNLFGYRKTRYRGLAKNTAQLYSLFALATSSSPGGSLLRITGAWGNRQSAENSAK